MIDIILWYVWAQVFAFGGLLISSQWLRPLPDRGYGLSKALGLLVGGFLYWIVVTLDLSKNEPGAILLALVLLASIGLVLRWFYRHDGLRNGKLFTRDFVAVIVCVEVLFAVSFIACAVYRAYNPDIVEAGGEKFMESMFVNAILRSPTFPPNDAWLSGFSISYYYFGYVLIAMLAKVSGVAPGVAFNLGGALIFALALTSAFSVGYNLWATYIQNRAAVHFKLRSAIVAGFLTVCMFGVMGNLGGFMESVRCTNTLPTSFWKWLDVRALDTKPVDCAGVIPTRFYWWWDWSRVIHDYTPLGTDQEVITETPSFSFILGDNHPHVMNLPFVLLAVGIALYYLTTKDPPAVVNNHLGFKLDGQSPLLWAKSNLPDVLLTSVILGGLSFMNTWDFPVFGSLVVGAILLRRWTQHRPIMPGLVLGASFFVLGYLLYLPFYSTFASQARGIGVNLFNGTRFVQFYLMFAPFLVLLAIFCLRSIKTSAIPVKLIVRSTVGMTIAILVIGILAIVLFGLISPATRSFITGFSAQGSVLGVTREMVSNRLISRISDPWVILFLAVFIGVAATLILTRRREPVADDDAKPIIDRFILLLFLGGMLLTLSTEFIFLQDLFATRMNTVFKFYYQAWTVWAIAAAFTLMVLTTLPGVWPKVGVGFMGFLILAGMLYPLYASLSRTGNFTTKPTLDGSEYLLRAKPEDANLISWLNANVKGAPVIVEAPGDKYGAYQYNGRISAFTGLPTLLGWGGHEHQWRGNYDVPAIREPLIDTIYATTDDLRASEVMRQLNVIYVIVGQTELHRYPAEGLVKFRHICSVVHQVGESTIYQCG